MAEVLDDEGRFSGERAAMVATQLVARGISDPRVLAAMARVPRHRFVEPALMGAAYEDRPLPIGHGQTISQPFMVARATELAQPRAEHRALEVGAGCGYQVAVLAHLCGSVFGIELLPDLAARAAETLRSLNVTNAVVESFDGSAGWREHAPFDVIIVSAGAPRIPSLLVDQLADGGRLVIPIGEGDKQQLSIVERRGQSYSTTMDTKCRYVDLLGRFGFGGAPPVA
jgi:protein-L-isoaspartate(D-aspartate) O-methyltransferase